MSFMLHVIIIFLLVGVVSFMIVEKNYFKKVRPAVFLVTIAYAIYFLVFKLGNWW